MKTFALLAAAVLALVAGGGAMACDQDVTCTPGATMPQFDGWGYQSGEAAGVGGDVDLFSSSEGGMSFTWDGGVPAFSAFGNVESGATSLWKGSGENHIGVLSRQSLGAGSGGGD